MKRVCTRVLSGGAIAAVVAAISSISPASAFAGTQSTVALPITISAGSLATYHVDALNVMGPDHASMIYVPVWYVDQALAAAGYLARWNGENRTWDITTTFGNAAPAPTGTGSVHVIEDGALVANTTDLVAKDPRSGQPTVYLPVNAVAQALQSQNLGLTWSGTRLSVPLWAGVSQVVGATGIPLGQYDALSLLATKGGTMLVPWRDVHATVSGGQGATVNSFGVFNAVSPGVYTVNATFAGHAASPLTIHVYGQPANVEIALLKGTAPLSGTDTVRVYVTDSQGNTVRDFNGTVRLSLPAAGGALSNGGLVTIQGGTGTAQLTAPASAPGQSVSITSSGLTANGSAQSVRGVQYGEAAEQYVSASAH